MHVMDGAQQASAFLSSSDGLNGNGVREKDVWLSDIRQYFQAAPVNLSPDNDTLIYHVSTLADPGGERPGGLCFGVTRISPGVVSDEYHMTRGHVHVLRGRSEYYWGIDGEGFLVCSLLEEGRAWVEEVSPNSVHYVPPGAAHRLVNTGAGWFVIGACWPSDAGHDYEPVVSNGFGVRVLQGTDGPLLVRE